jgi:hypothetical protein
MKSPVESVGVRERIRSRRFDKYTWRPWIVFAAVNSSRRVASDASKSTRTRPILGRLDHQMPLFHRE